MSRRIKIVIAAMALATVLLAERDAEAIFVALTCGTPTSNCPSGVTCTYSWIYTCTTNGGPMDFYSNCVDGWSGCHVSTYSCPGTLTIGGSCYCYGSDLGPGAC